MSPFGVARATRPAASRDRERGSASLEFVGVTVLLLVPLVYLVLTLSQVQRASYAVSGAAREAGRVFVEGADEGAARVAADRAAQVVYADYGVAGGGVDLVCETGECLEPDSRVRARASATVPLPLVPDLARAVVPTTITLRAERLVSVGRFREETP